MLAINKAIVASYGLTKGYMGETNTYCRFSKLSKLNKDKVLKM